MEIIKMCNCRGPTLQTPFAQPHCKGVRAGAWPASWLAQGLALRGIKTMLYITLLQPSERLFCMRDSNAEIYGEPEAKYRR